MGTWARERRGGIINFGDIQNEIQARGFDFLGSTRETHFINRAYHRVCSAYPWPFLETLLTGQNAPVTISDLKQVLYVVDTTNQLVLRGEDQRVIREYDPDLTSNGNPEFYYLEGTDTLKVWPPNNSVSLTVRYIKVPADLAAGSTPVFPSRFHYAIVEGALVYAYRDTDNFEAAENHEARFQYEITEMWQELSGRQLSGHQYVHQVGSWFDFNS